MFAKTTKAIIGALVLTNFSFAVAASAYSAPAHVRSQAEQRMNRAWNPAPTRNDTPDYRGSAGDTNGF
jgi:hypothetical protein